MQRDETNTVHLGDGAYAHFTGFSIELMVNDHRSIPVVSLELDAVDKLVEFKEKMMTKDGRKK